MLVLFSTVLAGSMVAEETLACETSARWEHVDEASFDLPAPSGTSAVAVNIGCRFLAVPGARVDLAELQGLTVLGIRRGTGQVLVAATPAQADSLSTVRGPVEATVVKGGDWLPLLASVRAR